MEFTERTDTVTLPKGAGVQVLLKLLHDLFSEIPRVKEVTIRNNGVVSYTWYEPVEGQGGAPRSAPQFHFDTVMPYAVIRNTPIQEVSGGQDPKALQSLFNACHKDRLYPVCLVTGTETKLWEWATSVTGEHVPPGDTLFGYAVLSDKEVPDDVLILCASFARSREISDTYKSYKVTMEVPSG